MVEQRVSTCYFDAVKSDYTLIGPSYDILIPCLIHCGCFRSAADFINRALRSFPDASTFLNHRESLNSKLRSHLPTKDFSGESVDIEDYPDKGAVRRELYPWNQHEPDRFSSEALKFLNDEMEQIAPRLEVKIAELPLLRYVSS